MGSQVQGRHERSVMRYPTLAMVSIAGGSPNLRPAGSCDLAAGQLPSALLPPDSQKLVVGRTTELAENVRHQLT